MQLKKVIICILAIFNLSLFSAPKTPGLKRSVIEAHQVKGAVVYGKYAVVKLPINKGVTLWNPVAVTKSPSGLIYVANYTGEIYSLHDNNGDGLEDEARLFCNVKDDNLRYPTSILFKGSDLYVACTQEIRIYRDTNKDGKADKSIAFFKGFPWNLDPECWTFGLCFGPDGWLYCNLTTDSYSKKKASDPNKWRGAVLRIAPDGKKAETFATGIRFAPGMAFNEAGDLFLSDNKGSQNKTEEINHIQQGKFYGNSPKKYGKKKADAVDPLVKVRHGNAMGGIRFNSTKNNFGGTAGDLFASCWGSNGQWERGEIIRLRLFKREDGSYMAKEFPVLKQLGKIIDIEFGSGGDLYIAQFGRENNKTGKGWHFPWTEPEGGIYRMVEAPWVSPSSIKGVEKVKGDIAKGKQIFTQRACATCHAVDGTTDSFGPNLKDIQLVFNTTELKNQIISPASAIQVGYEKWLLTKKNNSSLMGRLVHSDQQSVTLSIVGNKTVTIPRKEIKSLKKDGGSMMPHDLLKGLSESDINNLIAYLQNLGN